MTKQVSFKKANEKIFKTLGQYVPIVARVHGGSHPEFHEVKKLFDTIHEKTKDSGTNNPELNEEFTRLRDVTNNYTVPGDVCESYEAVYNMLSEIDRAYHA
ncbi:MAG TPA: iron-sulfur cluster repair di-iron protein, ric [Clostridiales bacterium]|nr:iron-sulfur cluster repair di-iron protein, ric [Clostridiales bacterium]